jgi:hypothetical protein
MAATFVGIGCMSGGADLNEALGVGKDPFPWNVGKRLGRDRVHGKRGSARKKPRKSRRERR